MACSSCEMCFPGSQVGMLSLGAVFCRHPASELRFPRAGKKRWQCELHTCDATSSIVCSDLLTSWNCVLFNSPRVTGGLIVFDPFPLPPFYQHFSTFMETPEAKFFKPHMVDLWVWKKIFYTHFGDLGSWSLSYRSGTQFTLSPW